MTFDAADFIMRAGLGLEAEDRVLLGSHLMQGTHGGLLRHNSERYYQSIVWRALTPKYIVQIETDGYFDLILKDENNKYAFEMKRWMSREGEEELPKINKDLDKLGRSDADATGMIIFSAGNRGDSVNQMVWLEGQLPRLAANTRYSHLFETFAANQEPREFWIALWMLSA